MTKKNYLLSLLIVLLTAFASCKKDELKDDYNRSYQNWKAFKSSVKDNYEYTVTSDSWTGYATETTLTVKNGKVVQRAFKAKRINGGTGAVTITDQWLENEAQLNSHQLGAETLTLDQVYVKAKAEWLVKNKNVETYFENNNAGMISTAGFVEKGCMDDCFNGIKISFIGKILE